MTTFHRCGNNLFTTLSANVAAIDIDISVAPSGLDDLAVPFLADLGGEVVEVTQVAAGSPSSTWTVTRAYYGVAGVYTAGIPVAQRNYAEQFNELQDAFAEIQTTTTWPAFVFTLADDMLLSGVGGVIATPTFDSLVVSPGSGVDVNVYFGVGLVNDGVTLFPQPVFTMGGNVVLDVPAVDPVNYQILMDTAGVFSAAVDSDGQPAPTGYLILADVTVEAGDVDIDPADIDDRRVIV
jgi:hypothetical protein